MIKNIIFDFGGVIHDIRYENVGEAFVRHGVTNLGTFYTKDFQTPEMDLFEKGMLSPAEYRDYIRRATGHNLSDNDIDDIVNAILIDVPRERVELLLKLRQHYKVFLFSNTNQINYDCFTVRLKAKYGFDIFTECFDKAYFSNFMHCRKPAKEGFEKIIAEQHLVPSETLFIDDIAKNLDGAHAAGIHGLHLAEGTILNLFDEEGLLKKTLTSEKA
ncbi:MAG: HAD family phosphatase [Bacteroidales bacterium]|nr:HAD family phosphatase [Bacteroidales bacterium]